MKVGIIAAFIGAAGAITAAIIIASRSGKSGNITTQGNNSPAIGTARDVNTYYGTSPPSPEKPIADEIRNRFHRINPLLLDEIDRGTNNKIRVHLTGQTYNELRQLLESKREANDYFVIQRGTGENAQFAGGWPLKYQGSFVEQIPGSTVTDYFIVVTPKLRVAK